ncbi:hypothetical protein MRX96_047673 [Rhipicephalus microplus]
MIDEDADATFREPYTRSEASERSKNLYGSGNVSVFSPSLLIVTCEAANGDKAQKERKGRRCFLLFRWCLDSIRCFTSKHELSPSHPTFNVTELHLDLVSDHICIVNGNPGFVAANGQRIWVDSAMSYTVYELDYTVIFGHIVECLVR